MFSIKYYVYEFNNKQYYLLLSFIRLVRDIVALETETVSSLELK